MSYQVLLRKNSTGETALAPYELDWHKASVFWWTEGNMSCDCNRALEWQRATAPPPPDDPFWNNFERECGHGAFTAIHAVLEDGTIVPLDKQEGA